MAKTVVAICDLCMGTDGDGREPATRLDQVITLGVKRIRPRSLDLCDRHYKELVEPLKLALEEYGAPVTVVLEPAKPQIISENTPGPFWCQVPGCDSTKPLASAKSVWSHISRQHNMLRREYTETHGPLVPGRRANFPPPLEPDGSRLLATRDADPATDSDEVVCHIAGCKSGADGGPARYSAKLGNARPAQALGVHLARTHGIRSAKVTKTKGRKTN